MCSKNALYDGQSCKGGKLEGSDLYNSRVTVSFKQQDAIWNILYSGDFLKEGGFVVSCGAVTPVTVVV